MDLTKLCVSGSQLAPATGADYGVKCHRTGIMQVSI